MKDWQHRQPLAPRLLDTTSSLDERWARFKLRCALVLCSQLALAACTVGDESDGPQAKRADLGSSPTMTSSADTAASDAGAPTRLPGAPMPRPGATVPPKGAAATGDAGTNARPPKASAPAPGTIAAADAGTAARRPDASMMTGDAATPKAAAPARPKPPAGIDPIKLTNRPVNIAVNVGVTLALPPSSAFGSIPIAQIGDLGDASWTWTLDVGGRSVHCIEVDDDETGYRYFSYEDYYTTWDDGTVFRGDLIVAIAPNQTYNILAHDDACDTSYTFAWTPKLPISVKPADLAVRPVAAAKVDISTVIQYISTVAPGVTVPGWDLDDPCYAWTVEVDGQEVWCAQIVDQESGHSYFFYDDYAGVWDDGSSFVGDLLIDVEPDNSCDLTIYDFGQNIVYDFGDEYDYP